jgi:hypothetical protein
VIDDMMDEKAKKFLTYDEKEESAKGDKAAAAFSTVQNSPLRYMGNPKARTLLRDITKQIWQSNGDPDMSMEQAFTHALNFTSFLSDKKGSKPDMNGNIGELGRNYRAVAVDPVGNVVLRNRRGNLVHVPGETFSAIQDLRDAAYKKMQQHNLTLTRDAEKEQTTGGILRKAGDYLTKTAPRDLITAHGFAAGKVLQGIVGKGKTSEEEE